MQKREKRNSQKKPVFPSSNPNPDPNFHPPHNSNSHPSQSAIHQPLITPHHLAYQLPLYQHNWSIYLQLLLLDAMAIFGPQNWYAIAEYLNSEHQAEEISRHYYRVYGYHIGNTDDGKLGDQDGRITMLVDEPEYDIYIAAQKRQETRKNRQYKQSKQALKSLPESINIPKIPAEFGYEPYKKTFGQPYNQQAQIMIINLKFEQADTQQRKQSKIAVLKMYNDMITERQIVEREVMRNGLMQCKYSLSRDSLTIKIPRQIYDSESQSKSKDSKKRGRPLSSYGSTKDKSTNKEKQLQKQQKKSKYIKNQLFFRIKKRVNDQDLCQDLHVVYMKIKKYDQHQKIKNLLKNYQQKCKELKHLKDKIEASSI